MQEFFDVFQEEISGMPPPKEVEFCKYLIMGSTLISRALYKMAPVELKELKIKLDKLLKMDYIRPVCLSGGSVTLCEEERQNLKVMCRL